MISSNFYAATCKCGHTGKAKSYTAITFAIRASNPYRAEAIARSIPRVKHDSSTAILSIRPIAHESFLEILRKNQLNPFLQCHSMEEQEKRGVRVRIEREPEALPAKGNGRSHQCRSRARCRGKEIIRNFRVYQRMNPIEYEEDWYE